jgi:hypothetical protein
VNVRKSLDQFELLDDLTALVGDGLLGGLEFAGVGAVLEGDLFFRRRWSARGKGDFVNPMFSFGSW